ncbi:MAG TPA: IPT/TIG domain-containing protein, partial [Chryseolinea sp.]|nr:IPT/TIG domain-containing protein [Chryseolinea sp.]
ELDQQESAIALLLGSQTATITNKFLLKAPLIQSITPASAIAGTEVTLTGQYLNSSKTKVLFGDITAELKLISKTKVVCLVPTGPLGALKVSVRTGNGALVDDIDFKIQ